MPTVGDMVVGQLIPLKFSDYVTTVVCLVSGVFGIICTSIAIIALITGINSKTTANTLFTLTLLIGNLLFVINGVVYYIPNMIFGGWWSGPIGCIVSAYMSLISASVSLNSITAIAIDRYISVFHNISLTQRTAAFWIASIWNIPFTIIAIELISGCYLYELNLPLGNVSCEIDYIDRRLGSYFINIIAILNMSLPQIAMIYSYTKLILRYRDLQHQYVSNAENMKALMKSNLKTKSVAFGGATAVTNYNDKVNVNDTDIISKTGTKLLIKGISITAFFAVFLESNQR